MSLSGRLPPFNRRRGRIIFEGASDALPQTLHGPLEAPVRVPFCMYVSNDIYSRCEPEG